MSKHEHNHEHPANISDKASGCCGGAHAHDHETVKPNTNKADHGKSSSTPATGSHTHASHGAEGSCGCSGKHK